VKIGENDLRIGIDLGGSKIECIALNNNGKTLFRERLGTPAGDYEATVKAVAALVETAERETGKTAARVGIGIPGTLSKKSGLVKNANSVCLIGQPLDKDLEAALGRPVRLANDANCFALSEATDGAAKGHQVVFGAILGTGVGGGIVIDQKVITGPNAIAGEWGHNPLPWLQDDERPGPSCYCSQSGCLETFLSGPGLERDHFETIGEKLKSPEIVKRAQNSNDPANQTMMRYENRLARALAALINILDPDCIVIGGGLSNIDRLYQNVPKLWGDYVFSDQVETRLVAPMHGDSSGVRGAAWL